MLGRVPLSESFRRRGSRDSGAGPAEDVSDGDTTKRERVTQANKRSQTPQGRVASDSGSGPGPWDVGAGNRDSKKLLGVEPFVLLGLAEG